MKASWIGFVAVAGWVLGAAGCGSGGAEKCATIAGTWTIAEHCESEFTGQQVAVSQNGCAFSCGSPFDGWGGTVTGNTLAMSGPGGDGTMSCTGTITLTSINVTCGGGSCNVVLSQSGGQTNIIGKACSSPGECPSPHYCSQAGFCTRECASHADCGCAATGDCANACVQLDDTSSFCLRLCKTNSDCAVGVCQQILAGGGSACIPPA